MHLQSKFTSMDEIGAAMYQPKVGSYAVYEPPEEGWENWEQQISTDQCRACECRLGCDCLLPKQ